MSEPKYSVLLTDEQVNDLDLIRLVRQGKVNKACGNGYIIYNEKWHNNHKVRCPVCKEDIVADYSEEVSDESDKNDR